tara:strand:- start:674 stop:1180 length:507 start_codon:yes stop_codon:yes gene_type:complete
MEENIECPICLDVVEDNEFIKLQNCTHVFHKYCIEEWKKVNNTCPLCRKNISNIFKIKMWNNLCKKSMILEVKEINFSVFDDKNINLNEFSNTEQLTNKFTIQYIQIKSLKVVKNCLKINYFNIQKEKIRLKTKRIYLDNFKDTYILFNTIKESIILYQRKFDIRLSV